MPAILSIEALGKQYKSGHKALEGVDLSIERGEIFALLGPNGAGKTTLINFLRHQPDALDMFSTVLNTVRFSRGLFGKAPDPAYIEEILRDLSLWDKRHARTMELSGGMKRRVMIAKALSHEPELLFLDEPTAGVDVNLRRDMWALVRKLRERGMTIILTTHYIEEAEEMADRVGVINGGRLLLVEDKDALMRKMGKRQLTLTLQAPLSAIPAELAEWSLVLAEDGLRLIYSFDAQAEDTGMPALLHRLSELGIAYRDLDTSRSTLEDIFVNLVEKAA